MLTILVPTFNRKLFLERLFSSLENQTDPNFHLLLMDDGSSDGTDILVKEWSHKFSIEYHYHDNLGKPKTLVEGVQYLDAGYVFLLDSDAILKPNAIECINNDIRCFDSIEEFGGMFYCMEYPNGKIIGNKFDNADKFTTFQHALDFDANGDKAVIIKTSYLKQIEMPIFKDEKFITESVFMNRLSLICKCICRNESILITDYQEDGLTASIKEFWKLYPKGYHLFFLERVNFHSLPISKYISSIIALIIFSVRSKKGYLSTFYKLNSIKNKMFFIFLTPFAGLFSLLKII